MSDNRNHPAESAASPSILEIRSLQKAFSENAVLKDISLSVERGNVISIIGPSGSGKSTLLRCASFLEHADGGDILYDGQYAVKDGVYASKAELSRFRTRFWLVFQNFQLFPHYSVLKNVSEAPILHGESRDAVTERAMQLLQKMGLEGKENAYPYQLSGGQQQRVAIARALCMRPERAAFPARADSAGGNGHGGPSPGQLREPAVQPHHGHQREHPGPGAQRHRGGRAGMGRLVYHDYLQRNHRIHGIQLPGPLTGNRKTEESATLSSALFWGFTLQALRPPRGLRFRAPPFREGLSFPRLPLPSRRGPRGRRW